MNDHVAVVLPGSGYGADGPALAIPALALEQIGIDVVVATYPAWRPDPEDADEQTRFHQEVVDEILQAVAGAVRVTFVAKSLGTIVLSGLDPRALPAGTRVRAIWVTPVFGWKRVGVDAAAKGWPSLIVSGGADRSYDRDATQKVVAATKADELVLDGADHSLVVRGDVHATVDGFRRLADAVLAFASA